MNGPAIEESLRASAQPRDPKRTLTSLGVIVYDWDLLSDSIVWGPNAPEVIGAGPAWSTGRDFAEAVEASDGATRAEAIARPGCDDEGSGARYAVSYRLHLPSGRAVIVDDSGRWFADAAGRAVAAHGSMRLRAATRPETECNRDRASFLAQVASDITEASAARRPLTLFAITVANLGELNDTLGFEGSDRVIDAVVARLCATMRGRDRFVRYSGNRFALALRGCGAAEAEIAAARLTRFATEEPVGTPKGPASVRLAIGAASAPDHASEAGILLRRAEASLALVKRQAGSTFLGYDPALFRTGVGTSHDPLLDSLAIINGRRITLALQPVVEASSRAPIFHEALLRVLGDDGRVSPAGDVIPALERAGLVHLADMRMLELVADHLASVPEARVALNVSPLTMERPDWFAALSAQLGSRPGIAPRLIVEITETAAIHDPDATRRILDMTKALGVAVAIDDFGAGHTSFRNLRHFPIDILKIDGAFVQNLARSPDDRIFVRTLIDLAHHLGIATVAEWVEDEESARLLTSWGADFLQGDHCGRPELAAPPAERLSRVA